MGLGMLLGRLKIGGIGLEAAAVLFLAIGDPHWVRILNMCPSLMKNLELLVWRFSLSLLVIVRERAFFVHLNKLVDLLP